MDMGVQEEACMPPVDMDIGVQEEAWPRWIWTWVYKRRHGWPRWIWTWAYKRRHSPGGYGHSIEFTQILYCIYIFPDCCFHDPVHCRIRFLGNLLLHRSPLDICSLGQSTLPVSELYRWAFLRYVHR